MLHKKYNRLSNSVCILSFVKDIIFFSNNSGTTHYDSLQGSYWADKKDSRNEVI